MRIWTNILKTQYLIRQFSEFGSGGGFELSIVSPEFPEFGRGAMRIKYCVPRMQSIVSPECNNYPEFFNRLPRWSAMRSDSARIVRVGLAQPQVGNTELPATYRFR